MLKFYLAVLRPNRSSAVVGLSRALGVDNSSYDSSFFYLWIPNTTKTSYFDKRDAIRLKIKETLK